MFGKIGQLLELQAKINARGHGNSMFSSLATKTMNRLTQVLERFNCAVLRIGMNDT